MGQVYTDYLNALAQERGGSGERDAVGVFHVTLQQGVLRGLKWKAVSLIRESELQADFVSQRCLQSVSSGVVERAVAA